MPSLPSPRRPLGLLLGLLLAAPPLTSASPYPKDELHDAGYSYLRLRDCDSYCGADNQLCCSGGSVCTTLSGNIATCVGGGGGGWDAITTTWTETMTYTSTIMTHWEPAPQPTEGVDCIPKNDLQEACGTICCAGWQTCAFEGQCSSKPGYEAPSTIVVTTGGRTTTQYSAPYRITATTTVVNSGMPTETTTETDTGSGGGGATATSTTENPSEATETNADGSIGAGDGGGGGGGLSGGAIAGIVIGSLAAAALLLLIAFCCIARGLWSAIFGRRDDRSSTSYSSDDYSRRRSHSGWFGGLLGGGDRDSEKSHGGGKKWLGLAGLAAALFAFLNFRKERKPARRPERSRSRYTDSYYSYSDRRSPRASSSGRRTYQSRRTGGGGSRRPPQPSYYSRSRSSRS